MKNANEIRTTSGCLGAVRLKPRQMEMAATMLESGDKKGVQADVLH